MELLKKIFSSADSDKEVQAILAHAESLLEKNFYDWAAVEFNKALEKYNIYGTRGLPLLSLP